MRLVIVSSGRQTGKTTTLIEQVKEGVQRADGSWSRVMLVATEREAERLRRDFHLDARQVYSAQTWARDRVIYHQPPSDLYLDNLEDWLYSQLGQVPSMVSTSVPVHMANLPAIEAAQKALASALSAYDEDHDLLEDEDGAPYPEEVQELGRSLRAKMVEVDGLLENMHLHMHMQLALTKSKAKRNEQGLLSMAAALLPEPPRPQACPECLQGKHDNCDGSTWDTALDQPGLCPCYKAGHQ